MVFTSDNMVPTDQDPSENSPLEMTLKGTSGGSIASVDCFQRHAKARGGSLIDETYITHAVLRSMSPNA